MAGVDQSLSSIEWLGHVTGVVVVRHTAVVDPVAIMRRWWDEVWGEGRLDLIPELVAERYVRHSASGTVERDHEAFQSDMCQYQRVLHSATVSLDDVAVSGDRVWSRVTMQGVNLETGDPRTVSWLQVHRIENGRIAESWVLYANDVDWR
jgi:ketosteroid isomerase-like protein